MNENGLTYNFKDKISLKYDNHNDTNPKKLAKHLKDQLYETQQSNTSNQQIKKTFYEKLPLVLS